MFRRVSVFDATVIPLLALQSHSPTSFRFAQEYETEEKIDSGNDATLKELNAAVAGTGVAERNPMSSEDPGALEEELRVARQKRRKT